MRRRMSAVCTSEEVATSAGAIRAGGVDSANQAAIEVARFIGGDANQKE